MEEYIIEENKKKAIKVFVKDFTNKAKSSLKDTAKEKAKKYIDDIPEKLTDTAINSIIKTFKGFNRKK